MVWVPVAAWTVSMIHWMLGDEVDVITGILCICFGLGLGAYTMMSHDPHTRPFFVLAALSMLVLFPALRHYKDNRELVALDFDQMERAYETLGLYPNHLGAKIKIARSLHKRKLESHAITLAEHVLAETPKNLAEEEFRMLREWKRDLPSFAPLKWQGCPHCGCNNAPTDFFCAHCARPIWIVIARRGAFGSEMANMLLTLWMASVIGLVGIPLAAYSLPPQLRTFTVVGILIIVAALAFHAIRRYRTRA